MGLYFQDYFVIGLYFIFLLAIGIIFRSASKNSSDYFRGGGAMSWWMVGASSFMASFSAWTFVACGGRIYKYGTLITTGFILQGLFGLIMAFTIVKWYRRMRVITPVDSIYRRYGKEMEQFYAWFSLISSFLFSGVALYILAVFTAPVIGLPINAIIIMLGVTIVFMSVTGGAWAVVASDFVQMLVLTVIVCMVFIKVLMLPQVGGVAGFLAQVPDYQFDWTVFSRTPVMLTMLIAGIIQAAFSLFDMNSGAARYLCVRSDADAKKACLVFAIGFLVGPIIWFVPTIAASFLLPDIMTQFSHMKNPEEAAYLAVAMKVLPKGMGGLLICGIFAATMSSMDTGLNRASGVIVRNIYKPLFAPNADESKLLFLGKIITTFIGIFMIIGGIFYSKVANFSLYQWTQHFNSLIMFPTMIPMLLGLIFRKTPKKTPLIAIGILFLISLFLKFGIDYQKISVVLNWGLLTQLELIDFSTSVIALINISCGVIIYAVATLLYKHFPLNHEDKTRVESLFMDMEVPVLADAKEHADLDKMQFKKLGTLCVLYGGILMLGALLPNSLNGRLCFVISGGFITSIGTILLIAYRRLLRRFPNYKITVSKK